MQVLDEGRNSLGWIEAQEVEAQEGHGGIGKKRNGGLVLFGRKGGSIAIGDQGSKGHGKADSCGSVLAAT